MLVFHDRLSTPDGDDCMDTTMWHMQHENIIEEHESPGRIHARMQYSSHPERTSESQAARSKKDEGVDMLWKCLASKFKPNGKPFGDRVTPDQARVVAINLCSQLYDAKTMNRTHGILPKVKGGHIKLTCVGKKYASVVENEADPTMLSQKRTCHKESFLTEFIFWCGWWWYDFPW